MSFKHGAQRQPPHPGPFPFRRAGLCSKPDGIRLSREIERQLAAVAVDGVGDEADLVLARAAAQDNQE